MAEISEQNKRAIALLDEWLAMPQQPEPKTRLRFKWFTSPGRWKGELYVLPCIRFAWGREYPSQRRSYWTGLYWLQWSFHFGWNEVED